MEVGFAAALGVPIAIVTTDFQTYGPEPDRPGFAFPEPLLEQLAVTVERAHRLGPPRRSGGSDRFRLFLDRNLDPVRVATTRAINALLSARTAHLPRTRRSPTCPRLAFIEPSPYIADDMWAAVADTLRAKGWTVHVAKRLQIEGADVRTRLSFWPAPGGPVERLLAGHAGFAEVLDQLDDAGGGSGFLRRAVQRVDQGLGV